MSSRPPAGYVGRFAPTPSGLLHFGSLLAALASWLDARAVDGTWLLRMEDLDTPREVPGARDGILRTLEAYGLHWDGEPIAQRDRRDAYEAVVERLLADGQAYRCICSRKRLAPFAGVYPGFCRAAGHREADAAIRLRVPARRVGFEDRVQGHFEQDLAREVGDFIIRRRDGIHAYQLAVVVDDAWQGVTDVVRGADLLDSTPRQCYLQELLGLPRPRYLHVPLIVQPDGQKLGKRYRSEPLPADRAAALLARALRALGQQPPAALERGSVAELLDWARRHWQAARIPRVATLEEAHLR